MESTFRKKSPKYTSKRQLTPPQALHSTRLGRDVFFPSRWAGSHPCQRTTWLLLLPTLSPLFIPGAVFPLLHFASKPYERCHSCCRLPASYRAERKRRGLRGTRCVTSRSLERMESSCFSKLQRTWLLEIKGKIPSDVKGFSIFIHFPIFPTLS